MRCLLLDDEIMAVQLLESYLRKIPFLKLVGSFTNAFHALEFLQHHSVDVIFLDVTMPDISGVEFVHSLTKLPGIIVTSAYPDYAVESYNFNAIDYLLKPISFERFLKAVNKAQTVVQNTSHDHKQLTTSVPEAILVKSGSEIRTIQLGEIYWIEAIGNYVGIVLSGEKILSLLTMHEMMALLPSHKFVRIHKSYIVPLSHITTIKRHAVIIRDTALPIGRTYRTDLLKKIGFV